LEPFAIDRFLKRKIGEKAWLRPYAIVNFEDDDNNPILMCV